MRLSAARLFPVLLVFVASCADSLPTQPETSTIQARPHIDHPFTISHPIFGSLTRPGEVFVAPPDLYAFLFEIYNGQLLSRIVMYADSTFALEYWSPAHSSFSYPGRYYNSPIHCLAFDMNPGVCGATAKRDGNRLDIQFTVMMEMADFASGVYIRAPQ